MKRSKGFDPRRLRSRSPTLLRWRLGSGLATCLCCIGVIVLISAIASFLGQPASMAQLSQGAAFTLLGIGALLLWLGIWARRRCRIRQHQQQGLSLSRHL